MNCYFPQTWFKYQANKSGEGVGKRVCSDTDSNSMLSRGRGRSATTPSWMGNSSSADSHTSRQSESHPTFDDYDRVHSHTANQYVQIVRGNVHRDGSRRRMPISTDNDLP